MTDEKKTKKTRRPADVIAAEKQAWLARHEWAGPKKALELVTAAHAGLEEAQAACGERCQKVGWKAILEELELTASYITDEIPAEAR